MPLRILFFGTPEFAVPSLDRLMGSPHLVAGVVTQPDRRSGRGQRIHHGTVKEAALVSGIPVFQPDRLTDAATLDAFRGVAPDLGVVAAYGRLLPQAVLDVPRLGMINVHASLLPRWRGAAPVHRAVMAGDRTTGVTIMRVVLKLDAGPMLARVSTDIGPDETSAELERRLATLGADALLETVERLSTGEVTAEPQDERQVTYASRLERRESRIDWSRSAVSIQNQIRGLQPWPLAGAVVGGRRVMFLRATATAGSVGPHQPGVVSSVEPDAIVVGAGEGVVRITELQPAGRPAMTARAFLSGHRLVAGDVVESLPLAVE
jgi:methionyl-tRNA formyltransferase